MYMCKFFYAFAITLMYAMTCAHSYGGRLVYVESTSTVSQ